MPAANVFTSSLISLGALSLRSSMAACAFSKPALTSAPLPDSVLAMSDASSSRAA